MGGSYEGLCETKNYKWLIYENHSDAYKVYELRVRRKKDDTELEIRPPGSGNDSDKCYEEFDNAFDELEKEKASRFHYKALTKEQITLAEMWHRMKKAEQDLRWVRNRKEELEKLFNKMDEIRRTR